MRNVTILIIIIAVIIGGYTAFWFKKADDFKLALAQTLTNINDRAKTLDAKDTFMRYSSIEATGYPFAMNLKITKPIIDLPISALLQTFPRANKAPAAPSFEWIEEISYGDSINISSNMTASNFTFSVAGDRTSTTLVDRASRRSIISTTSMPFTCHLNLNQDSTMPWTVSASITDAKSFINAVRSADCKVENISMKDAKSGDLLVSGDLFKISASKRTDGVYHKVSFDLESKNFKATPAFDSVVNDYMFMANTLLAVPNEQRFSMTPASTYGDQNIKIALSYEGPTESGGFTDPAMHFQFDVDSFDLSSSIFNLNITMHASSAPSGDTRDASFVLHSNGEVSPIYDQLVLKQFNNIYAQMKPSDSKTAAQNSISQNLTKLGTPEEVAGILPKFSEFGKTNFDIDIKVHGPNTAKEFFSHGNIDLSELNWVATPYGIKINGKANLVPTGKMPSGELVLSCLNCDAFITDLGNYVMRVDALLSKTQNPPQPPHVTKELVEGIRGFTHEIAEDATSKDLVIRLVVTDAGQVTVSGKQINDVYAMFIQNVAPYFPHQSATPTH